MKFLEKEINKSPLFGLKRSDTIKSLQMNAFNEFIRHGLPNRSWEDWKYSDFSLLNNIASSIVLIDLSNSPRYL